MLFRKKMPRSCTTCLHATVFSDDQFICIKRGIVENTTACRKYRYDPCKRIPPVMKAPEFSKYNDEAFKLE